MMSLGQNVSQETYYGILSVKEDASYDEIRASYRSSVLKSHPDKIQSTEDMPKLDSKIEDTFHNVQRAWEILGCSSSRAMYDSELKAARRNLVMADDVLIEDMVAVENGEDLVLHYHCRCGDCFTIDSFELESMGYGVIREKREALLKTPGGVQASLILPCPSCSLKVRILCNHDSKVEIDD